MADRDWNKVLIPILRKTLPTLIAQEIVGVQPMVSPKMLTYEVVDDILFDRPGYTIVFVNIEVGHWIESQPAHMWKYYDIDRDTEKWAVKSHYVVSDELLTWLKLRWS